jgi:hypothetical protein
MIKPCPKKEGGNYKRPKWKDPPTPRRQKRTT